MMVFTSRVIFTMRLGKIFPAFRNALSELILIAKQQKARHRRAHSMKLEMLW